MALLSAPIPASVRMAMRRKAVVDKARIDTAAADLSAQYLTVRAAIENLETAVEVYDQAVAAGLEQAELNRRQQDIIDRRANLVRAEEGVRIQERIVTRRFPEHFQWINK